MTRNRDFKKKVRARMAKTGERYSTARAKLLAARTTGGMPFGGVHPDTAALRVLLAQAGVLDPATQRPLDEALLLGLGGGIGAAYYVFEYAGHLPNLYVETRVGPQYPYTEELFERVADHLGVHVETAETGSDKRAAANLERALEGDRFALAWVDMAGLPHHHLGDSMGGALPHVVLVSAVDADSVTFFDRSSEPFTTDRGTFEAARQRLRKAKNRVLWVSDGGSVDPATLEAGIERGLSRCRASLDGTSGAPGYAANMGIRALEKWAALIDANTKKGWPRVFPRGPALASGLRQGYFWIEAAGTGGGAFRRMFAEFLDRATQVLKRPQLADAAERYRRLADRWTELAHRMLPSSGKLGQMREILDGIEAALIDGPVATDAIPDARARLEALTRDEDFDLGAVEVTELYADLKRRLQEIARLEREARALLGA